MTRKAKLGGAHGAAGEPPTGATPRPQETRLADYTRLIPSTALVPLDLLLEPPLPMREGMDEAKMQLLMASLTANGQLVPLIVITRGDRYEITDGHRRYIAAQRLGWASLRCEIYAKDGLAVEAAKVAAMLDREDVNAAQEAMYYKQLVEKYKLDEAGLVKLVRRTPDYIGRRWKLLLGDPVIFECLRADGITLGVAAQLNRVPDEAMRRSLLDAALRSGTSERVVRQWVEDLGDIKVGPAGSPGLGPPAPPAEGAEVGGSPAPASMNACRLCGGWRDPANLTSVLLHVWEWEALLKLWGEAAARVEAGKGGGEASPHNHA